MNALAVSIAACAAAIALCAPGWAGTENFDTVPVGALPSGWVCGVTGGGTPMWRVEGDASAPSKANLLKQSGAGTFPWCADKSVAITDGSVEVKFKPLSGREDQAGGVVWRFKDGDTYYLARANALEDNVALYYTERGRRNTIRSVRAPVAGNQWHVLRVEFEGTAIRVSLDGKPYIAVDDAHISGAGAVGVWTKADSVTAFDDFIQSGR